MQRYKTTRTLHTKRVLITKQDSKGAVLNADVIGFKTTPSYYGLQNEHLGAALLFMQRYYETKHS
ncbi:hypothetical protein GCM10008929_17610 [Alkalibacterium psychrotolerans]